MGKRKVLYREEEEWKFNGDPALSDPFAFPGEDEEEDEPKILEDLVRRIALFCLPAQKNQNNCYRSGYIRWCALLYVTNRDLFAQKSQAEIARQLDISPVAFHKHIRRVRERGISE